MLVPIGACEAHGPHLPLGTDGIEAWVTTIKAAEKADVPHTPLIWMGYSPHHMGRCGAITVKATTLQNLLYDVARSLIHHGFNKIIFVCGHTSNLRAIFPVVRKIRYDTNAFVAVYAADSATTIKLYQDLIESPSEELPGWHGGEIETSEVLAFNSQLVHLERAKMTKAHAPRWLSEKFTKSDGRMIVEFEGYNGIFVPLDHVEYSDTGILGNPLRGNKEKGEKIFERISTHLAKFIEEVKKIKVEIKNREFVDRVL